MKIGIDIQDIRELGNKERIFSHTELEYIASKGVHSQQTAIGLYCAKEAFFKALGTGIQHSKLVNVEILHNEQGAPYYNIKDTTLLDNDTGEMDFTTTLSISHTKNSAVAVCIISTPQQFAKQSR